jgi:MYXO-CTERM domain-containing protein
MAVAGTQVYVESSVNGSAFSANSFAVPGDWVLVQVRVSEDDPAATVGLAGVSFRLGMTGLHDEPLRAWSSPMPTSGTFGGGVHPQTGLGRVAPFGTTAASTVPGVQRWDDVAVFTGSGTAGVIACGQASPALMGTKFNSSTSPVVFRYGFTAGTLPAGERTIRITIDNFLNNVGRWYTDLGTTSGNAINIAIDSNPGGTVTIVPTPGVLGAAGAAGAWSARRRRRGSPCERGS